MNMNSTARSSRPRSRLPFPTFPRFFKIVPSVSRFIPPKHFGPATCGLTAAQAGAARLTSLSRFAERGNCRPAGRLADRQVVEARGERDRLLEENRKLQAELEERNQWAAQLDSEIERLGEEI